MQVGRPVPWVELGLPGCRRRRYLSSRALTRRYLKPRFARLRCSRRGCLCAFSCVVDALPEQCLRRRYGANPLVAAVLELSGYRVNAALLHVNAADILVRRGIDGTASDNRRSGPKRSPGSDGWRGAEWCFLSRCYLLVNARRMPQSGAVAPGNGIYDSGRPANLESLSSW